jgi:hypothetical protein
MDEPQEKTLPCSRCGKPVDTSPYECATGKHRFCQSCVDDINASEIGLNCPIDGSALVS